MKTILKWLIYILILLGVILFTLYLLYILSFTSFDANDTVHDHDITIKAVAEKYKYNKDINSTSIVGVLKVYGSKDIPLKSIDLECFQVSLDNYISSGIYYHKEVFDIVYNNVPTINNMLRREVYWSFDRQIPIDKKSIFKIKIKDTCNYDDETKVYGYNNNPTIAKPTTVTAM